MVDLRKLFNQLEEVCEEEVVFSHDDETNLSAVVLNPKIEKALLELKEGIDDLEQEAKERIKEVDNLRENLDEMLNSLY